MSNPIWQRLPLTPDMHCLEMKDRAQARVAEETRDASPDMLVTYFREASRRFWREAGLAYPQTVAPPMTVSEPHQPASRPQESA